MSRLVLLSAALGLVFTQTVASTAEDPAPKRTNQYEAGNLVVPPAFAEEAKVELSIDKADKHLRDGALAWSQQRKCVTCHTNGSYMFIRPALTETLGPPSGEVRDFFVQQFESLRTNERAKFETGTRTAQVIYIAAGLAQWDRYVTGKLSPETKAALEFAFQLQNEQGAWQSLDCWPPFESSAYQEATMVAMAAAAAPNWLESLDDGTLKEAVDRLKSHLGKTEPPHDYARVLQLWASLRLRGILSADQQQATVQLLRDRQQADGGWSVRTFATPEQWGRGNRAEKLRAEDDFANPSSDGHMTGLALLVLQEAGVPADDDQLQNGIGWLKKNQRESGRWWTRSLNTEKWHFISYSGTAYAILALQRAGELKPKAE